MKPMIKAFLSLCLWASLAGLTKMAARTQMIYGFAAGVCFGSAANADHGMASWTLVLVGALMLALGLCEKTEEMEKEAKRAWNGD